MKKPLLYAFTLTALGGCFYTETPYGRTAVLNLPVHSQTTINKTVTVNAPPLRLSLPALPAPVSRASGLLRSKGRLKN